jgi:hypothetical protein
MNMIKVGTPWQLYWNGTHWRVGEFDKERGWFVYRQLEADHIFYREVDAWGQVVLIVGNDSGRQIEVLIDGKEAKTIGSGSTEWTRVASATKSEWNITGRYADGNGVIPNARLTRRRESDQESDQELPDPQFKVILRGG